MTQHFHGKNYQKNVKNKIKMLIKIHFCFKENKYFLCHLSFFGLWKENKKQTLMTLKKEKAKKEIYQKINV